MRTIKHPGTAPEERHQIAPTAAASVQLDLKAGQTLLPAIATTLAKQEADSGILHMANVITSKMTYVLPATSPTDEHVAWYSNEHTLPTPGKIHRAWMTFGKRDDQPFIHCHGLWESDGTPPIAGHMYPETCVLAEDTTVRGWTFKHARFDASFDQETNFTLFQPVAKTPATENANAVLVRLRPNVEIGLQLQRVCADLDWQDATVHGIGSLIGARFKDGRELQSYATELFIEDARITPVSSQIDITIGGITPGHMTGRLKPNENTVLITCELVLLRT